MQDQEIRDDFAKWTGGLPPGDWDEIELYIEVASIFGDSQRVREVLRAWMQEDQQS